jgi:hypothetical protein
MRELDIETVMRTAILEVLRWYSLVDGDELRQTGELYLLEHPQRVEKYQNMRHPATAALYLRRDLTRVMYRVAREEKAAHEGYSPVDEFTYTADAIQYRGLIAECLRAIVTGTREQAQGPSEGGRSTADPAVVAMNFATSLLDIERGWERLDAADRHLLAAYFVYGVTADELGQCFALTDRQVFNMLKSALRRLVAPLNGGQISA